MTDDWLAPDALVVAVDYATYCAAEVAREAALFLVDQREQFLANRDAGNFDGYPDPTATIGEAIVAGTPRPAAAGSSSRHLGVGLADLVFGDGDPPPRRRARPGHGPPARDGRRALAVRAGTLRGRRRRRAWRVGLGRARHRRAAAPHPASSSSSSSPASSRGIVGAVTIRALPDDRTARSPIAGPRHSRSGHPRRERHRPDRRRRRPTTCSSPRATSTPRSGCGRWRSGATSRPGRLSELFGASTLERGPVHPDARLAPVAAERDLAALSAGRAGRARRLRRRASTPGSTTTTAAVAAVRRHRAEGRARRRRRLRPRAVDRARHARLAEGPGVAARRQLRQRDLPDARRREARRPGPDRRAVPAVRRRRCR